MRMSRRIFDFIAILLLLKIPREEVQTPYDKLFVRRRMVPLSGEVVWHQKQARKARGARKSE